MGEDWYRGSGENDTAEPTTSSLAEIAEYTATTSRGEQEVLQGSKVIIEKPLVSGRNMAQYWEIPGARPFDIMATIEVPAHRQAPNQPGLQFAVMRFTPDDVPRTAVVEMSRVQDIIASPNLSEAERVQAMQDAGTLIEVPKGNHVVGKATFGRESQYAQVDLIVGSPVADHISRKHFSVSADETGVVTVADHASTNGTLVQHHA